MNKMPARGYQIVFADVVGNRWARFARPSNILDEAKSLADAGNRVIFISAREGDDFAVWGQF